MSDSAPAAPLKSRLGREIYTIAALLASLPLVAVGLYSFYEIDTAHREQAQRALDQSLRSFGEMLFEKFRQSSELAGRMINEQIPADELPQWFLNYAVTENSNIIHSTFAQDRLPQIDTAGTPDRPQIAFGSSTAGSRVFLSISTDARTFIGELDQFRLWADSSLYPFATEFCITTQSGSAPVYCSTPLPQAQLQAIQESESTRGSLRWENEDGAWETSFWDLFLPSAFEGEPIRIIGSQPESIFASAATTFRQAYLPALALTVLITLIGAGYHARRFLEPISSLLAATRRFTERDFRARATVDREDEFRDLADALNGMAQSLDRQFRQRDALSRLDYLILAGDGIEDVLRTAVYEALSYLPFDAIELDIQVQPDEGWFRYSFRRDDTELNKQALGNLVWPEVGGSEHVTDTVAVATINVGETVRGAVRGTFLDTADEDTQSCEQLEQLAERLAMALEFHEQSIELHRRAWFDDLTGLPNRESCLQKIDRAIATAEFNGHMVALLYIDLDGFKSINDSLGHDAGDQLIALAAERITRCVGHHGVTARLGGDEFAVIIPYSAGRAEDYKVFGKLILTELQEPFKIGNSEAYLGASIGAARYPEDGDTYTELLRKADAAMYRAKDSGRGRQVDYSRTLGIVIAKRLRLELDLNRALERDEMTLVFQPQVDLATGAMNGAEALLRWNHSTEGLISPDEFIPIAEETNQILTLGNWVLFNACAQLAEWRERGVELQRIAVNVSANQLRHSEFLPHVRDCIERFKLAPGMLELELTERVFVDAKEIAVAIHALKKLGVIISIDDFGTGYSSLGALRNLEFDTVKIDRSFVTSLPHDKQSASIIQAVIAMCRTLDKKVVAEGVETSLQLQYLAEAGVEYAQGHYFSKPVAPQEFEFLLRRADEATDNTIHRIVRFSSR